MSPTRSTVAEPAPGTSPPGGRPAGRRGGEGRGAGGRGARLRWPGGRWAAVALLVAAAATGAGYGVVAATAGDPAAPAAPALGPGTVTVRLDVEHSLFAPVDLRVVAGTRVRFVVVNGDPIAHELIVGPPELHARHASGSEGEHPSVPGETSVPAGGTAITTQTFAEPGTVEYACHLPGHYEYGMHGEIEVVPA